MNRHQLIALARKLGVDEQYHALSTKNLIWAIQEAEGNADANLHEHQPDNQREACCRKD